MVPDTHSSVEKDIAAQSDSDTGDVTDTIFTQCTDNTETPYINVDSSAPTVFMLIFFEITQLLLEERNIITGTWTHWTKGGPHCLT